MLEKLATPFRLELTHRFDTLRDEETSIEKMNKILNLWTPYKTKHKRLPSRRVLKIQK